MTLVHVLFCRSNHSTKFPSQCKLRESLSEALPFPRLLKLKPLQQYIYTVHFCIKHEAPIRYYQFELHLAFYIAIQGTTNRCNFYPDFGLKDQLGRGNCNYRETKKSSFNPWICSAICHDLKIGTVCYERLMDHCILFIVSYWGE